ncbi:MAG: hypothetical protein IKP23_02030 [Elusimicrobiaceae bacterium]|nr:hypothetical protein [Elusimicrobiaceae bacterium]
MKILTEFIQNPEICLKNLAEGKKLSYACFGYAFGIISLYFAIKLGFNTTGSIVGFAFAFIFWFITNIILNFVLAAICNTLLEMTENQSSSLGIFIFLGLSQVIWSLTIPCFLIAKAFPLMLPFVPLLVLGIIAAQIYFVLNAIKQVYGIARSTSMIAFMGSFVLPFAACFFFLCFMIGFIAALAA